MVPLGSGSQLVSQMIVMITHTHGHEKTEPLILINVLKQDKRENRREQQNGLLIQLRYTDWLMGNVSIQIPNGTSSDGANDCYVQNIRVIIKHIAHSTRHTHTHI